jgi:redox-sensing transcriptional repressor
VTEILVQAGIKGIWNFAPESLVVPQDVVVKNEDLSSSLALLANQLANR